MAVDLSQSFDLRYAGTPFVSDALDSVEWSVEGVGADDDFPAKIPLKNLPPFNQQPLSDLIDDIERVMPRAYLFDFAYPQTVGRNVNALAARAANRPDSNELRLYDWYYPTTASRWGVFRGLMTSSMVKKVLQTTKKP